MSPIHHLQIIHPTKACGYLVNLEKVVYVSDVTQNEDYIGFYVQLDSRNSISIGEPRTCVDYSAGPGTTKVLFTDEDWAAYTRAVYYAYELLAQALKQYWSK